MEIKLIDNHTHGAFGINFNYSDYLQTVFVLKELYKRNIVGICPTLVGETPQNIQRQLALFKKIKQENIKDASLILGVHLEGSFLSKEKPGIQDKNYFLDLTIDNFKNLTGDFEDIVKIVTLACENDVDLIDYLNNKNIKTQAGHSNATSLKNCIATTHHFNAMPNLHHRNPSITLQGLIDDDIYCEIIADLIHVSLDMLKLFFKSKPKNKILLVSDSIPAAHSKNDVIFCGKKINSKGKDEFNTLAGSVKLLDEIAYNLIDNKILDKDTIKKIGFLNQIEYINPQNADIDILMK